jgi:hypothetical protein
MAEDFGEIIRKVFDNLRVTMENISQTDEWKQLFPVIEMFPVPYIKPQYLTGVCLGSFEGITDMNIPIQAIFNRVQNITTCIIILWPDEPSIQTDFSGIAVLNPKDEQDNQDYANRLAFKRAARKAQEHFTIGKLVAVRAHDLYSWYRLQLRTEATDKGITDEIPY